MRLIDADKLKKHYAWWEDDRQELFDSIVDRQPTIEAEPVIRCVDCKHRTRQFGKDHYCRIVSNVMPDNGFCSMAERSSDVRDQDA